MHQRAGTGIVSVLLLGAWLVLEGGSAAAQDKPPDKVIAEQKAIAQAYWKRVFEKDLPLVETKHFLVCGEAPGRKLAEVGDSLEKAYAMVGKILELGKEEPWPGKMTVFLAPETKGFNALVRTIEKRLPEEGERGLVVIRSDTPHILTGPSKEAGALSVDGEAVAQLAAALLTAKITDPLPEWLVEGFSRASAFLNGPSEALAAERQRALALVNAKHTAKQAWDGTLKGEDAAVVRASVIEYLAFSGKFSRFPALLAAFRRGENQQSVSTDVALATANIAPAGLNTVWQRWVKNAK